MTVVKGFIKQKKSNMYKTPTHALYVQYYIILTC